MMESKDETIHAGQEPTGNAVVLHAGEPGLRDQEENALGDVGGDAPDTESAGASDGGTGEISPAGQPDVPATDDGLHAAAGGATEPETGVGQDQPTDQLQGPDTRAAQPDSANEAPATPPAAGVKEASKDVKGPTPAKALKAVLAMADGPVLGSMGPGYDTGWGAAMNAVKRAAEGAA